MSRSKHPLKSDFHNSIQLFKTLLHKDDSNYCNELVSIDFSLEIELITTIDLALLKFYQGQLIEKMRTRKSREQPNYLNVTMLLTIT